jgi:hypothetical protein
VDSCSVGEKVERKEEVGPLDDEGVLHDELHVSQWDASPEGHVHTQARNSACICAVKAFVSDDDSFGL